MYDIMIDRGSDLIDVRLAGMMSVTEVRSYIADLGAAFVRNRLRAGYRMRIDVSDATIQNQEIIAELQAQIVRFPKASRIAIVTGSSLARMQVRRVMKQPYAQVFTDADAAREWLMAQEMAEPVPDLDASALTDRPR